MILPHTVSLSAFRARRASQGMADSLSKRRNAAMGADKLTHRAPPCCSATALQHLTREWTIACVLCLVAKQHGGAEYDNIMLKEY